MLVTQEQLPIIEQPNMLKIHNEEIKLIRKLHDAAKDNDTQSVVTLLNELIDHITNHFLNEEKLMQEVEYPDFHIHRHEHTKQLMDIQAIRSFFEMTNDTQSIASYLHDTLSPWIIEHTKDYDSQTSQFLIQNNKD